MKPRCFAVILLAASCFGQQASTIASNPSADQEKTQPATSANPVAPDEKAPVAVTVPAGTRALLVLLSPVSSKSAQSGNGIYLQTVAPIAVDNKTVIPAGTHVQGVLDRVQRPGRVKGRAQLQMHFTSLTFPSGYHATIPATIGSAPAEESAKVKKEGTIEANTQHGQDATVIAGEAGTGSLIGALADGGRGAGIGAGAGAAAGLLTVLLTRGNEVRMEAGDPVEMVLERALVLDHTESQGPVYPPVPVRRDAYDRDRRPAAYPASYPAGYPYPGYPPYWPLL